MGLGCLDLRFGAREGKSDDGSWRMKWKLRLYKVFTAICSLGFRV